MQVRSLLTAAVIGLTASTSGLAATLTANSSTADYSVTKTGVLNQAGTTSRIGYSSGGATSANAFYVYAIPALPTGDALGNAHVTVTATGKSGGTSFNGDLYAVGTGTSTAAADVPLSYYEGTLDSAQTLIQDNLLKSANTYASGGTSAGTATDGDAALTTYLAAFYATHPGYTAATPTYLFLRLNPDADASLPSAATSGFTVQMAETSATANVLTLTTSPAPEPAAFALLGFAGITLGRRRRQ